MGAEYVQWGRTLFHGGGICFMGAEYVSWGLKVQNMGAKFHEDQLSVVVCSRDAQRQL